MRVLGRPLVLLDWVTREEQNWFVCWPGGPGDFLFAAQGGLVTFLRA